MQIQCRFPAGQEYIRDLVQVQEGQICLLPCCVIDPGHLRPPVPPTKRKIEGVLWMVRAMRKLPSITKFLQKIFTMLTLSCSSKKGVGVIPTVLACYGSEELIFILIFFWQHKRPDWASRLGRCRGLQWCAEKVRG